MASSGYRPRFVTARYLTYGFCNRSGGIAVMERLDAKSVKGTYAPLIVGVLLVLTGLVVSGLVVSGLVVSGPVVSASKANGVRRFGSTLASTSAGPVSGPHAGN